MIASRWSGPVVEQPIRLPHQATSQIPSQRPVRKRIPFSPAFTIQTDDRLGGAYAKSGPAWQDQMQHFLALSRKWLKGVVLAKGWVPCRIVRIKPRKNPFLFLPSLF